MTSNKQACTCVCMQSITMQQHTISNHLMFCLAEITTFFSKHTKTVSSDEFYKALSFTRG